MPRRFFYGWIIALAAGLGLATSIATVVAATFSVFIGPLRAELGWDPRAVFVAPIIVTLLSPLVAPAVGAVVDRFGARRVILVSFLFEAAILASFYYLGSSVIGFYLRYAALGMFAMGTTHVAFARLIALWFDRRRGLALGIALSGVGVGGAILPPVCNALIEHYGWRLAYVGLALLIMLVTMPLLSLALRDTPQSMNLAPDGDRHAERAPRSLDTDYGLTLGAAARTVFYWKMLLTFFAVGIAVQSLMLHLIPMLAARGVAAAAAAGAQSMIFLGLLFGRLVTGWFMDRFFAPRVALAFLLPAIAGIAMLAFGADGRAAFVAAALIGLSAGAEVDVVAYLTSRYFGLRQFSRIYGTFYGIYSIGGGLGPLLTQQGVHATGSYAVAMLTLMGLLVGAALLLATYPPFPQRG
jgi:MFS family permease